MSIRQRDDPHTLAGPYALNALSGPERVAFERHLSDCEACRQEAGGLHQTAAQLGEAAATSPPPQLRTQVLTRASRTRQLPPLGYAGPAGIPAARHLGLRGARRMAVALAGGAMLVALAVGTLAVHIQQRLHAAEAHSQAIAAVLNAPDATMMTARAGNGVTATVVMSHTARALVLTTARLPDLPAGKRYQVWLMGPQGVRAAGMLPTAHHGMTAPVIVSGLGTGDKVGVTVERASGAPHPTTAPVLMVDLPS